MNEIRSAIKFIVILRLKDAGLANTPTNRWQILEDLRTAAHASIVVLESYRTQLDIEIDWNEYAIESL